VVTVRINLTAGKDRRSFYEYKNKACSLYRFTARSGGVFFKRLRGYAWGDIRWQFPECWQFLE
jgi:hypothetical protein